MAVSTKKKMVDGAIPAHVAVIMDGNGRWAQRRGLPRLAGHQSGISSVRPIINSCASLGVSVLSLFAFSSENWFRPREEVRGLMKLLIDALEREVDELDANGIRLKFIGDITALDVRLCDLIKAAEARTYENTQMDLVLAVAYGGKWDLAQAARMVARRVLSGQIDPGEINEEVLSRYLNTAELPSVDLLIRTGGEKRISNFLLWELAYSEIYFSDVLWPDFKSKDFDQAIEFFANCRRRFGRTSEQAEASNC